ncbi:MAG: DUF3105 domain-containing protein [Kofleriaceae bacterium]
MKLTMAWIACAACTAPQVPSGPQPVGGACNGMTENVPSEEGVHVAPGTQVTWSTNPPVTGAHYPVWGAYDRSYAQLDRGYYLHDAEHGAIVLLYNCPDGCPDTVTALEAVVQGMPTDPMCTAPVRQRALVTSDPLLPAGVTVAAVAWDNWYTATCTDGFLATFASEHYGAGPEQLCSDGANLGGTLIDPLP